MKPLLKLFVILLLVTVAGCSGAKLKKDKPADVIYKEAMDYFEHEDYEDAIAAFQELNAKYPVSDYTVQAKLRIADSYYMNENYPEAISAYRDFEKLHPTNDNVPYAIFQTGMSYFNQMLTIDRDQTPTMNVVTEFTRLLSRFPNSQYTDAAKKNLVTARNNLSENEFYVANFYFKKGNYKAALERLDALRSKYPEFEAMDKVLFYAAMAYIELDEKDKGKTLLEKLSNDYPLSSYTIKAKKILGDK
jgi:outer membrane protein assembly factor BamD